MPIVLRLTRKQCHGCHGLLIFIKSLFALNDWIPSRSKSVHYHGIQLVSVVNYASRACNTENRASRCHVRSCVTRIIRVHSCVTLQILGPSRVMQKPLPPSRTDTPTDTWFLHFLTYFFLSATSNDRDYNLWILMMEHVKLASRVSPLGRKTEKYHAYSKSDVDVDAV